MKNLDQSLHYRYRRLLLLGLVAGSACSRDHSQPDRKAAITAAAPTENSQRSDHGHSEGSDDPLALVITPGLGVGRLRFGMSRQEMEQILGKADRTEGRAHEYLSKGMAVIGSRDAAVAALMFGGLCVKDSVLVGRCQYRTSKGIRMGSSEQEITAAYGPPSSSRTAGQADELVKVLIYDEMNAKFSLRHGRVVHMTFRQFP